VTHNEEIMEFVVELDVNVPDGTPDAEVKARELAEASAAAKLVDEGRLATGHPNDPAVRATTPVAARSQP
jgi:hypothetical protein